MNKEDILSQLSSAMVELFELNPEQIVLEARLQDDLDLDSIDAVDMAVRLQALTGHKVELSTLKEIVTVGDVVDLVYQMKNGKPKGKSDD